MKKLLLFLLTMVFLCPSALAETQPESPEIRFTDARGKEIVLAQPP